MRRNTLPYNVDEKFAGNDFVIESYEEIRQLSKIEAVTKGGVDGFTILNGGTGYKVGDTTNLMMRVQMVQDSVHKLTK